ncbi:uncharacterized protein G2W53_022476 [Senna tora]|uniref:Uncharacterized protein n=1 Tax=Senna tora TaxID=362788 RepID=A0A834WIS2_9FABA|nr:uncharacterized protein G2W53_022476 [Senna tora]
MLFLLVTREKIGARFKDFHYKLHLTSELEKDARSRLLVKIRERRINRGRRHKLRRRQ